MTIPKEVQEAVDLLKKSPHPAVPSLPLSKRKAAGIVILKFASSIEDNVELLKYLRSIPPAVLSLDVICNTDPISEALAVRFNTWTRSLTPEQRKELQMCYEASSGK